MKTASVELVSQQTVFCGADGLDWDGQRLKPDDTKGYVEFRISHALPVITAYGCALDPGTITNSFVSMQHQVVNLGHQMKAYHPDDDLRGDRIVGSVVGVKLVNGSMSGAPAHIHGVAVIHKLANGLDKVLGQHQSGRHEWTVSMEVRYDLEQSGWAVGKAGASWDDTAKALGPDAAGIVSGGPERLRSMGFGYVPWGEAPEELRACYSDKETRVVSMWSDQPAVLLMGGVDGRVHYMGVGIVPYGAEPTARLTRVMADHPALRALQAFGGRLGEFLQKND